MQIENLCSAVASHNMGSLFHHAVHVFRDKLFYYTCHYSNYTTVERTEEFARKTLEVLKANCV